MAGEQRGFDPTVGVLGIDDRGTARFSTACFGAPLCPLSHSVVPLSGPRLRHRHQPARVIYKQPSDKP